MKKIALLMSVGVLVVALLAGTATALPGSGKGKGKGKGPAQVTYVFKGTVSEVTQAGTDPNTGLPITDPNTGLPVEDSITVDVTGGNNATKQLRGSQTFSVNDATKIEVDDQEDATLDQISEGDKVVVQSKAAQGTTSDFVARMISAESPETDS